jgi:DNA-binding NtrC family response regulator
MKDVSRVSLLIVDDDTTILTLLRERLRDAPAIIQVAASADEALARITVVVPDLIISDYRMPGSMNGLDLLFRVSREHPQVRCVLHTGDPVFTAPGPHPFEVLAKPCPCEAFLTLIDDVRSNDPRGVPLSPAGS